MQLSEPVIQEIYRRLTTNLAAEIAMINRGVTDGFLLEAPQRLFTFVPPLSLLTDFPVIGLQRLPSRFEDDAGSSVTGVHRVSVVVFISNTDQEALTWQLARYEQAVADVVLAGRNLTPAAWGCGLEEVVPGPTLGDTKEPSRVRELMSWTAVTIWAKRDE